MPVPRALARSTAATAILSTVTETFSAALPPRPRANFRPVSRMVNGCQIEGFEVVDNEAMANPSNVIRQTSPPHPVTLSPFLPATLTAPIIIEGDGARVTLVAEDANLSRA